MRHDALEALAALEGRVVAAEQGLRTIAEWPFDTADDDGLLYVVDLARKALAGGNSKATPSDPLDLDIAPGSVATHTETTDA